MLEKNLPEGSQNWKKIKTEKNKTIFFFSVNLDLEIINITDIKIKEKSTKPKKPISAKISLK